jgi:hypothetical protein
MPTYAELRQQVVATLPPGVDAVPVRWGLAYAALQGGVQGAAIALVTSGRDWDLVEDTMAALATHFAAELAQRRLGPP